MSDLDRKILTISGVKVMFPCKPYPSQFSMMDRVIKGLERRQNCLLESPTGSGKSLALLCSALAWQCTMNERLTRENLQATDDCCKQCTCGASESTKYKEYSPESKPKPAPDLQGGGRMDMPIEVSDDEDGDFKPAGKYRSPNIGQGPGKKRGHIQIEYENEPATTEQVEIKCTCNIDGQSIKKKLKLPKIYFGTRTHKQIAQIVRELGKTEYHDVRMAILGSREHTCVHPEVSRMKNKSEGCRERLDGPGCSFNDKAKRVFLSQGQLQEALPTAWDLEDLVTACRPKKACPYFVTRNVIEQADIVFCPYNYLIDPLVRSSMEINLKGQIVILDEAHNIEDSARDAASGTVSTEQLNQAIQDLQEMVDHNVKMADHLAWRNTLESVVYFMEESDSTLEQLDYDTTYKVWSGFDIVARLKNLGLGPDQLDEFKQRLGRISASDENQTETRNRFNQEVKLNGRTLKLLELLVQILDYMYRNDMQFVEDYRVAVMKSLQFVPKKDTNNIWMNKNRRGGSRVVVFTLNFWCMNPAVAFSDFSCCRNIVLSSGTLSPMSTFASELGVLFPVQLEANHVIEDKQVWVGALGSGPTGTQLQAVYKSKETYAFQDELGSLIHRVCMTVPHGVLCFLPSYRDVQKFVERWKVFKQNGPRSDDSWRSSLIKLTGVWNKVAARKRIMIEPRAVDKEDFDNMMRAFYEVVKGDTCNDFLSGDDQEMDNSDIDGALFIAVCRGKVSEGMDFADNNARAVITVGIPFPSIKDLQVTLKKAYNDKHRADRGLLSGMEWYEIQAFRALNQALGRCIRHRKDWGALIMVDDRFVKNPAKYCKSLSKWVRSKVRTFESFSEVDRSLTAFTEKMQKEMPVISPDTSFIPCTPCTPGTSRRESVYRTQSCDTPSLDRSVIEKNQSIYFSPKQNLGTKMLSPPQSTSPSQPKLPSKTTPPTQIAVTTPVSSLTLQQQLMQIINSDTAPKDAPYYIILNQGQPNEQTFLIEPNKNGKSAAAQDNAPSSVSIKGQGNMPTVSGNMFSPGPTVVGNMLSTGQTTETSRSSNPGDATPVRSHLKGTFTTPTSQMLPRHKQLFLVNSPMGPLLVTNGAGTTSQQGVLNGVNPALTVPSIGQNSNKTLSGVPSLLLQAGNSGSLIKPGLVDQSVQGTSINSNTKTQFSQATAEQSKKTNNLEVGSNENKFLKFCQLPKTHSTNVPVATVTPQKADKLEDEPVTENPTTGLETEEISVPGNTSPLLFETEKDKELKDKSEMSEVSAEITGNNTETKKKPLFRKAATKALDVKSEDVNTKSKEKGNAQTKELVGRGKGKIKAEESKPYGTRSTTCGNTNESIVNKLKRFRRSSTGQFEDKKLVLKEIRSPVTGKNENKDVSQEESDDEFLNTRRRGGRKRRSKEQHRSGQKKVKGVVYEGEEEDVIKENKENILSCVKCGTVWSTNTAFDRSKKQPDFMKGVSQQVKEVLSFVSMDAKTCQLQTFTNDSQGTRLNCYVDDTCGCCVQFLQCKGCGTTSKPVGARVVMADSSSTYTTGQTWILASAVK